MQQECYSPFTANCLLPRGFAWLSKTVPFSQIERYIEEKKNENTKLEDHKLERYYTSSSIILKDVILAMKSN